MKLIFIEISESSLCSSFKIDPAIYTDCTPKGGKAIRIYWLTSNVLAALCAVCAAGYWAWTLAHPAQTNAESWRNARLLIGGLALVGILVTNAIVADAIALLKGLPRA